jgi:hypothetical protein
MMVSIEHEVKPRPDLRRAPRPPALGAQRASAVEARAIDDPGPPVVAARATPPGEAARARRDGLRREGAVSRRVPLARDVGVRRGEAVLRRRPAPGAEGAARAAHGAVRQGRAPLVLGMPPAAPPHDAAAAGASVASALVEDTRRARQKGQVPSSARRACGEARHSCSGFTRHRHQTPLAEPAGTCSGVSAPFFVGCHWRARSGRKRARLFVTEARRPAQNGHPVRPAERLLGEARHSWSAPSGHFHHTRRPEPYETSSGTRVPFFVGCHCATSAGQPLIQ